MIHLPCCALKLGPTQATHEVKRPFRSNVTADAVMLIAPVLGTIRLPDNGVPGWLILLGKPPPA